MSPLTAVEAQSDTEFTLAAPALAGVSVAVRQTQRRHRDAFKRHGGNVLKPEEYCFPLCDGDIFAEYETLFFFCMCECQFQKNAKCIYNKVCESDAIFWMQMSIFFFFYGCCCDSPSFLQSS